jgi:hypothetical protein
VASGCPATRLGCDITAAFLRNNGALRHLPVPTAAHAFRAVAKYHGTEVEAKRLIVFYWGKGRKVHVLHTDKEVRLYFHPLKYVRSQV